MQIIYGIVLIAIFLVMPAGSFVVELFMLFMTAIRNSKDEKYIAFFEEHTKLRNTTDSLNRVGWIIELILFSVCFGFERIYLEIFKEVIFAANWQQQLYNKELHQPINPEFMPGVVAVIVLFLAGMVFLYLTNVNRIPPLISALAISTLYIGSAYSIIWTVHIMTAEIFDLVLLLLPINVVLISLRLIIKKASEFKVDENRMSKIEDNSFLAMIYKMEGNAFFLPIAGLVLVIPLLGVMALILILFGQAPDSAIKAFTQTSDFALSTKISPQNLEHDQHYLCTVAAGGDKKIVKPLRKGIRHEKEIVVNRQLLVANAFEEILIIHTPRFHKIVRHIYDTYGFPVAKLIKKSWIADIVYILMKPAEVLFLLIIYMVEIHPEDRIWMQYTGSGNRL